MAINLHSDALTLPCSATFADAQTFVHHHAMTAVNGKTTFFKGFMARFVGKNAIITCFEVKGNGYAFNPVMGCGQPLVRPLTAEDVDRLGPACLATVFGVI